MNDTKTTDTPLQSLNRAIIRGLTRSPYAGDIIADRLEELERERDTARTREAELAKALRRALTAIDAGFGKAQRDHIKAHGQAALQSPSSQNNPKETKA